MKYRRNWRAKASTWWNWEVERRAGGQDQVTGSGPGEIGNYEEREGQRARQGLGRTQDKDGGITKRDQEGEGSG